MPRSTTSSATFPPSQLLQMRTGDLALHAWDLATAIGVDAGIPEELAAAVYQNLAPMAEVIGTIGMFGTGPSGTVGEDAPVTVRLLDLSAVAPEGRREDPDRLRDRTGTGAGRHRSVTGAASRRLAPGTRHTSGRGAAWPS